MKMKFLLSRSRRPRRSPRRRLTSPRVRNLRRRQCAACHGKDFASPVDPSYPKLAGQYSGLSREGSARLPDRRAQERDHGGTGQAAVARPTSRTSPPIWAACPVRWKTPSAERRAALFPVTRRGNVTVQVCAGAAREAVQVARAHLVRRQCLAGPLRGPDNFTQALHHVMRGAVRVAAALREPLIRRPYAGGWSIDNCSAIARCIDRCRNGLVRPSSTRYSALVTRARQFVVILGMLDDPVERHRLDRRQQLGRPGACARFRGRSAGRRPSSA